MKKSILSNKYLLTTIGCIIFLLLWIVISAIIGDTKMIFPDPLSTFKETFRILGKSYIYKCIGWTMLRMIIGFSISFILALLFGVLAGNFPSFKVVLKPTITALKSIPTAALVFLFLVITNAKYAPIFIVILISFPILYEAVAAGVNNTSKEILDASKVDGANHAKMIWRIRLPLAIPYILVGITSSFALAFKIEIMAEVITGSTTDGLGSAILAAQKSDPSNMVTIFAYSLIAILFILILTIIEELVYAYLKKKTSLLF